MKTSRFPISRSRLMVAVGAATILCIPAFDAVADPVYVPGSGTGAVSFGVTNFGAVGGFNATYILNNVSGRVDILNNAGLVSNSFFPTIGNNIANWGGPLPGGALQVGGGNGNGPFGNGIVNVTPMGMTFSLADAAVPLNSSSFAVATSTASFTDAAGTGAGWGTFIAFGGSLPVIGSGFAASVRTFLDSANPASPFFGGLDLPELVLSTQRVGPLLYAGGGFSGGIGVFGAHEIAIEPLSGQYRAFASNVVPFAIPAGDAYTVTTTITLMADPASMSTLDMADVADLFPQGFVPPSVTLAGAVGVVPEPPIPVLAALGAAVLALLGRRRRNHA